jgi:hypothetical protein
MAGRERAAVVGNGIAAELALRLRGIRDDSGLNLRQLADRTGYSTAVLSTAESGRRTPSWEVIAAFVTACGGRGGEWRQLWELAAGHWLLPDPMPGLRADTPSGKPAALSGLVVELGTDGGDSTDSKAPAQASGPRTRLTSRRRTTAIAVGLVVIASTGAALYEATSNHQHASSAAARLMDGKDPLAAGCRPDALAVSSAKMSFPDAKPYGTLVLMYSASCQAAWGSVSGTNSHKWAVHIEAVRPTDRTSVPSVSQQDAKPGSWGNMASTQPGCVLAEAWITENGRDSLHARTSCVQGTGTVVRAPTRDS